MRPLDRWAMESCWLTSILIKSFKPQKHVLCTTISMHVSAVFCHIIANSTCKGRTLPHWIQGHATKLSPCHGKTTFPSSGYMGWREAMTFQTCHCLSICPTIYFLSVEAKLGRRYNTKLLSLNYSLGWIWSFPLFPIHLFVNCTVN
jgi:hypothetical protein